jgi:hypothetical protein
MCMRDREELKEGEQERVNLCEWVCVCVHVYKYASTSVGQSAVLLMPPAVARKVRQLGLCQSDSSP